MLFDWSATAGIKPDGSLVWWSNDNEFEGTRPVDDAHHRHLVLAEAFKRHPELACIAPVRTEDALTCAGCGGTGTIEGVPENVICACGGLGWIPRELEGLQQPRPEAHQ